MYKTIVMSLVAVATTATLGAGVYLVRALNALYELYPNTNRKVVRKAYVRLLLAARKGDIDAGNMSDDQLEKELTYRILMIEVFG